MGFSLFEITEYGKVALGVFMLFHYHSLTHHFSSHADCPFSVPGAPLFWSYRLSVFLRGLFFLASPAIPAAEKQSGGHDAAAFRD